jgi:hypothetical protein
VSGLKADACGGVGRGSRGGGAAGGRSAREGEIGAGGRLALRLRRVLLLLARGLSAQVERLAFAPRSGCGRERGLGQTHGPLARHLGGMADCHSRASVSRSSVESVRKVVWTTPPRYSNRTESCVPGWELTSNSTTRFAVVCMRSATSRTIASVRPAGCTHSAVRLGSGFDAVIVDVSTLAATSAAGAGPTSTVGVALEV